MNRKAFRCGVLALLLTAAFALPAISAASAASVSGKRVSRSSRPAVERGILERAWGIVTGLWGGTGGGLHAVSSANRGGIDPNGAPVAGPQGNPLQTPADCGSGDNRGGIDPNG